MTRLAQFGTTTGVLVFTVIGWGVSGFAGLAAGSVMGAALFAMPWKGHPAWVWAWLFLTRNRRPMLTPPITVVNDRSSGGVRYQDGVVITAVHLIGKPHRATLMVGSTITHTDNTLDLGDLLAILRTSLGMEFDSVSVVSTGARRRTSGDYPRIYDSFIGTSPYAGQRDTWLVLRINALDNAESIRLRSTAGTAALAATQRVAAALSCKGIRARVATATEIADLDDQVNGGCLTSYEAKAVDAEALALPWSLRVDRIIQNLTLFADSTVTATVTVGTPQPLPTPPSTALRPLPGQQWHVRMRNVCAPLPRVRGLVRHPLPESLAVPLGSSGVLVGKVAVGDRLLMPLEHPGGHSHIDIAADDSIAKRIVIRTAAAGAQVTVHTTDTGRWNALRMPNVVVTDQPRPAIGTTVSVTDGTVPLPSRPAAVITQTGPSTVTVRTAEHAHDVEMEFFRAENRYVA